MWNRALVLVVVMALALVACGDAGDDSAAEEAAQAFFEKLEDHDADGVQELLCENRYQNLSLALPDDDGDVTYDFDVDVELADDQDEDDGTVLVNVTGRIRLTLETDDLEIMREEKREEAVAWQVRVSKFEDDWFVCGGQLDYLLDAELVALGLGASGLETEFDAEALDEVDRDPAAGENGQEAGEGGGETDNPDQRSLDS
ncbi:MAG: hypothetical protein GYB65_15185 [Chloroflexi bacterium]|nr:hypothetical protein [Chloroflexota bacterium]